MCEHQLLIRRNPGHDRQMIEVGGAGSGIAAISSLEIPSCDDLNPALGRVGGRLSDPQRPSVQAGDAAIGDEAEPA